MKSFYAPGKVLLTGEYLVLNGFEAIALPTNVGQTLHTWEFDTPGQQQDFMIFEAKDQFGEVWLTTRFSLPNFEILDIDKKENIELDRLAGIFQKADPAFWKLGKSLRLETNLQFNRVHGLGSSSTLVTLLSDFMNLDALSVQFDIFGGSGYDVAIAKNRKPLVYWLTETDSNWDFWKLNSELTQNWSIVFYGQKMDSRTSLKNVQDALNEIAEDEFYTAQIDHILNLTKSAKDVLSLEASLEMYQKILSQALELSTPYDVLEIEPVAQGLCKWLGAWGGDMILVNKTVLETYQTKFEKFEKIGWTQLVINH